MSPWNCFSGTVPSFCSLPAPYPLWSWEYCKCPNSSTRQKWFCYILTFTWSSNDCVWLVKNESLENVQRCALQIIVGNIPSEEVCRLFDLPTLAERRFSLCSTLFRQITRESHVLHYLLPVKRDAKLLSRLRSTIKYPTVCDGQTDLRTISYRIHFRTSSATCSLDCVNVLNL